MKTTFISTTILALCLSAPALAKKRKQPAATSQAGNVIETSYKFDKDNFGAGTVLNLGVQAQTNGGNAKTKRDMTEALELYIRDIEDEISIMERRGLFGGGSARGGDSKSTGGNKITNDNNMSKAQLGNGNVINMNTQTQVKGGNSQSGPGGINFGKGGAGGGFSFGKRAINGGTFSISSRISSNGQDVRSGSGHDNFSNGTPGMTMHFARGGFLSGGDAKGGGSSSKGGISVSNKNDFRNMKMAPGSMVQASTQNVVKGGNSRSGAGGANYGAGGAGGQFSMQLPPLPPIKRSVEDFGHDAIFAREILNDLYDELYVREAEAEADPELEYEDENIY